MEGEPLAAAQLPVFTPQFLTALVLTERLSVAMKKVILFVFTLGCLYLAIRGREWEHVWQ